MKHSFSYILLLVAALVIAGCADDEPQDAYANEPLEVGVTTLWQCGRSMGTARALADPLGTTDGSGNSLLFPDALYPEWLHITMRDGLVPASTIVDGTRHPEKYLIRQTFADNDYYDDEHFIAYHDFFNLSQYKGGAGGTKEQRAFYSKSQTEKLTPEANTLSSRYNAGIPQAWDDQDIPTAGNTDHLTTKPIFGGSYRIDRNHLFLTLGHATALLRLHFAVDSRYSTLRYIDLHDVTIAGHPIVTAGHLILQDAVATVPPAAKDFSHHDLYAYAYVKPAHGYNGDPIGSPQSLAANHLEAWAGAVSTSTPIEIRCTYDVYDRDAVLTPGSAPTADQLAAAAPHRTRKDVVAANSVTLGKLGATISVVKAGYYYDLYITINPDYLYVLSEHDNKHVTIE